MHTESRCQVRPPSCNAAPDAKLAAPGADGLRHGLTILLAVLALLGPLIVHALTAANSVPGGLEVFWLLPFLAAQMVVVALLRSSLWLCAWPLATGAALIVASIFGADARWAVLATAGVAHALIFGSLGAGLGASLLGGQPDLVTRLARRLDPNWSAEMAGYTRGVAMAWTGFFFGQCAVSALLALWAPREVWWLFVNVLDLPLVAAMFLAEYAVRLRRFPAHRHLGVLGVVRAVRDGRMW